MDADIPSLGDMWMKTAGKKAKGCDGTNGTKRYCVVSPLSNGFTVTQGYLEPTRKYGNKPHKHGKRGLLPEHFSAYTFQTFLSNDIRNDMWEMVKSIETEGEFFYSQNITLSKRNGRLTPSVPIKSWASEST